MNLIDLHCDTVWKLMDLEKAGDFGENRGAVSIPKLRKGHSLAQFFACFGYLDDFAGKGGYDACYTHILEMTAFAQEQIARYSNDIGLACSAEDIEKNKEKRKISAVLTVEEGGVIHGKMERLHELYERGIRMLTLLWNYENCIGHPNSRDARLMQKGLKPFGAEVVERMNELGMLIDISHASDGTFWDVLDINRGGIMATHSNCRALCSHPRNLTDDMIKKLAAAGGIAGLNFYGPFLGTISESRVEEMVAHILHMLDIGGSDFPAIGTDFDGFDGMEKMDIPDSGHMEILWEALRKAGISEQKLEKIWNKNAMRVLSCLSK